MNLYELYLSLKDNYKRLDPHHDTWILWTKPDKTKEEIFEVAIGTILVQNTNWKNVDKAIENLKSNNVFTFPGILECDEDKLIDLIRPAGFFNQKKEYLKSISKLFVNFEWNNINRELLLKCKGVGKETADSILNYCLYRSSPIVGTYTKRFFAKFYGNNDYLNKKYEKLQQEINVEFEKSKRKIFDLGLFHALIVVHSQNVCLKKKPLCNNCNLKSFCKYNNNKTVADEINLLINPIKKK